MQEECATLRVEEATRAGASLPSTARDHRIDVLRGAALLVVFSDHVEGNIVSTLTLLALGGADCADIFVFVSGFVCGRAWLKSSNRHPWRATRRCLQIYFALILSAIGIAGASHAMQMFSSRDNPLISVELGQLRTEPTKAIIELLTLRLDNGNLSILKLYVILFAVFPVIDLIDRMSRLLLMATSIGLYAIVQIHPHALQFPEGWQRTLAFNPFAWQLLFVAALLCGAETRRRAVPTRLRPWFFAIAVILFQVIFAFQLTTPAECLKWSSKFDCGPLRLLQLFALMTICTLATSPGDEFWGRTLRPIAVMGQHSLPVFCFGVLYSGIATACMYSFSDSITLQVAVNVLGWVACLATGYVACEVSSRFSRGCTTRPGVKRDVSCF